MSGRQPESVQLDALYELTEAFMGLSNELDWATSESIARRELLPVFVRCSKGQLSPEQALDFIIDLNKAKQDHTMNTLRTMFNRLMQQLSRCNITLKDEADTETGIITLNDDAEPETGRNFGTDTDTDPDRDAGPERGDEDSGGD